MSRKKSAASAPEKAARRGGAGALAERLGWVAVLLLVAGFVVHAYQLQYTQDDAYISLRYAKNLVEGEGLVFNPGERTEGYSNFTWTLLLALFLKLGAPPIEASRWLGVFFGAAAILVAARFARALEGRVGPATLGTAALIAGNSAYALWSTGGLETALFGLLVTWGLERGFAPGVSERGRMAAPLLLCLAALTRPDGPLLFAGYLGFRVLDTMFGGPGRQGSGWRGVARDLALFVGPLVPYAAWKLWYFGDLLPNTYYAKAGVSIRYVRRGLDYALEFFAAYGVFGLAPLLAVLSTFRDRLRGVEVRLLAIWLLYAAYIVGIGGDVLHVHRFWLPLLPIGCLLVARGASVAADALVARFSPAATPSTPSGLAFAFVVLLVAVGLPKNWDFTKGRRDLEVAFVQNMTTTGKWLGANLPPDAKIAITTIGAISYWSNLHCIDMLGLTDREIARSPQFIEGLEDTWREIKYNAESVLSREPDAILFSTGVRPSSAAEKALFLYESFYENYYPYYFRSEPWRPQIQSLFRRRAEETPFTPARIEVDDPLFIDRYMEAHIAKSRNPNDPAHTELFRAVVEEAPNFPWGIEWLGVSYLDAKVDGAVELLERAVAEDPYATAALGRLANHYLAQGDFERAKVHFERLREICPSDNLSWMGLAEIARRNEDWGRAYELAKNGVALWDTNAGHLTLFGVLALTLGSVEEAEWAFDRTLRLDPNGRTSQIAREGLAQIRAGGGRP